MGQQNSPLVLDKALQVINKMEAESVIAGYAIGGAVALLFFSEPALTFDLDIFCQLPSSGILIDLGPVYEWLKARGYQPRGEHVMVEGVPIQFLPTTGPLLEEALHNAVAKSFSGVPTRVIDYEYLLAIMVQTNRAKDRARSQVAIASAPPNEERLNEILSRYNLLEAWRRWIE